MTTTVKNKKQINMKDFTKKIIGALCILFMINITQAQNELDIIGNWEVDSIYATASVYLSSEELDQLMLMVNLGLISAEEFLDEMGFPMPTTPQEWNAIATNGITVEISEDEIDIDGFVITESVLGILVDEEGVMSNGYSWSNDNTISFTTTSEEFPFTEFTIVSVTSDNLIMSSSATIVEDDEQINYNITFYCTSAEEFTFGCTDPSALNYDVDANIDDGSCEYPYPCTSNELLLTLKDEESDGWEGSELIINGTSYTLEDGDEETFCIELADCWIFSTIEGEFMEEASWMISDENDEIIEEGGLPYNMNDVDEDGECDDLKIEELSPENNSLIKVIDILGREHKEHHKGMVLFYIYENGKVIKKINAE
tara:strand:- start:993 stop:2102 length:1110 start_codon:yes stop_codon:yes gene_type:complete